MFDESGYPKYNLGLEKDKPVSITFDVTSDHKEDLQNEDSHLPLNKEEGQENKARHEDLVCAFWDSHSLNWSSKGCNTIVGDAKIVGNLLPRGTSHRQTQTHNIHNTYTTKRKVFLFLGRRHRNVTVTCKCNHLTNFAVLFTISQGTFDSL